MANLAIRGGERVRTSPFPTWPQYTQNDIDTLASAIASGSWARTNEKLYDNESFIYQAEQQLSNLHQSTYAILVSSGTAALDIALQSIELQEGDEVLVPSYSFIASATCILNARTKPVFVDIRSDTLNIDFEDVRKKITNKTKALVIVHFAGQPVNMDQLLSIKNEFGLAVIEDAAHALGACWNGQPVGTVGDLCCFSFQQSKNVTCGEGGAILTNNPDYYERCLALQSHGRKPNGSWYDHVKLGWNYRITQIQAALLLSQMRMMFKQALVRNENIQYLRSLLKNIDGIHLIGIENKVTSHSHHLFVILYNKEQWNGLSRKRFSLALNLEGIPCLEGYPYPIYQSPVFSPKYEQCICPVAERVCKEAIWFSHHLFLGSKKDMEDIRDAIIKIKNNINEIAPRRN